MPLLAQRLGQALLQRLGRPLADILTDLRGPLHGQVRHSLVDLAGADHGNAPEDWVAWAMKLP